MKELKINGKALVVGHPYEPNNNTIVTILGLHDPEEIIIHHPIDGEEYFNTEVSATIDKELMNGCWIDENDSPLKAFVVTNLVSVQYLIPLEDNEEQQCLTEEKSLLYS